MAHAYCTVATASFLPFARVLASSLRAQDPQCRICVLLIDAPPSGAAEPFEVVPLSVLPEQDVLRRMSFYFTAYEFSASLKARFLQWLLTNQKESGWMYLDADILALYPLDVLWDALETSSMLLTPHLLFAGQPAPLEERKTLLFGLYNTGFFAVRNTETGIHALSWLSSRTALYGFQYKAEGLFVDQRWCDFLPIMYPAETQIFRHPGANVGPWNLHERPLRQDQHGQYRINDDPLLFFHFGGWGRALTSDTQRVPEVFRAPNLPPAVQALAKTYGERLRIAGYANPHRGHYGFQFFADGHTIPLSARRAYYEFLCRVPQEATIIDPFASPDQFWSFAERGKVAALSLLRSASHFLKGREQPRI